MIELNKSITKTLFKSSCNANNLTEIENTQFQKENYNKTLFKTIIVLNKQFQREALHPKKLMKMESMILLLLHQNGKNTLPMTMSVKQ